MKNVEIDLLTEQESYSLKVSNEYGKIIAATDLAHKTNTYHDEFVYACQKEDFHNRSLGFYLKSSVYITEQKSGVITFNNSGILKIAKPNSDIYSIRPVLRFDKNIDAFNEIIKNQIIASQGFITVELGEYPQWAPDEETQNLLDWQYLSNGLTETGRVYSTEEKDTGKSINHNEYLSPNGKKYILFEDLEKRTWIEVSPVVWLVDEESKLLISKRCLLAGVIFSKKATYNKNNFKDTNMYHRLQIMFNEIFKQRQFDQSKEKINISENKINEIEEHLLTSQDLSEEELKLLKSALEQEKNNVRR